MLYYHAPKFWTLKNIHTFSSLQDVHWKISSFLSIIPGSAVLPGIFLQMQMPRFLSPPKLSSETLQDGFKNWCFTKVARLFWCMLKFENQGSESLEMGVSTEWAEWVIFWGRCLQKRRGEQWEQPRPPACLQRIFIFYKNGSQVLATFPFSSKGIWFFSIKTWK